MALTGPSSFSGFDIFGRIYLSCINAILDEFRGENVQVELYGGQLQPDGIDHVISVVASRPLVMIGFTELNSIGQDTMRTSVDEEISLNAYVASRNLQDGLDLIGSQVNAFTGIYRVRRAICSNEFEIEIPLSKLGRTYKSKYRFGTTSVRNALSNSSVIVLSAGFQTTVNINYRNV